MLKQIEIHILDAPDQGRCQNVKAIAFSDLPPNRSITTGTSPKQNMTNPTIEIDIAEILKDLQKGQKDILKEISEVKINLESIKGDLKALDTKVEQLDKRVANQEFLNRGVFIGLLLALLGGIVNFFGWIPKS